MRVSLLLFTFFFFLFGWGFDIAHGQIPFDSLRYKNNIWLFLEETNLPIDEIKAFADSYFKIHGTKRGSGYKQYQRWLYERQFHLDALGYLIDPEEEYREYLNFVNRSHKTERSVTPWTELGPTSWSATQGWNPGIGRITSVAVQISNASIIYVSSPGGGIWKTTDGGSTWTPLMDQTNSSWMNIYHVAIDPSNTSTLYAAVAGGGIIKSINSGTTWTGTGSGPSSSRKVIVHPTNSNIVFATASNGIYRSTNGGTSWTQASTFNAEDIEFKPGDPNIMMVSGTHNTLKRSTDNGVSWSTIGAAQGITNYGRTLLGVSAANPNIVYAVQAESNSFGRMYKSTNAGQTFVTTVIGDPALGTNYFGYEEDGTGTGGQANYDMAICVNPTNANEVHIAGIICWKSTNSAVSFNPETVWYYPNGTGYNHADVHSLEWVGTTIYSSSDGGVYKSTNNGGDWTDISAGIGIRQLYRMSNSVTNSNVITIGAQDNGSSYRQPGANWIDWLGADGMDNMISPTNSAVAYGTSQFGSLYKTTNSGSSYSDINTPADGNWVTPIAMDPVSHSIIYGGWNDVYKSTNSGGSWTNLSTWYINKKLDVLAVAKSNTNFIYAAAMNKIFRTQNGGTTWDSITLSFNVTSIYISASDPQKIWVTLNAISDQVLYSTNMGNNFTVISAGLPGFSARSVVVDEGQANGVYVGMNLGVYYKNDFSPVWSLFGTSLPLVAIQEVEIQQSSGKIRVATYGRGVWENGIEVPPCSSYVIYNTDSGLGSLRSAIGCITASDTITFAPSVVGQYIDLSAGPLVINRNIKILQTAATKVKLRTLSGGPVFTLSANKTATFKYVDLYAGTNPAARAISNFGILKLENVTLFDNVNGNGSLIENKGGSITVSGTVQVKD